MTVAIIINTIYFYLINWSAAPASKFDLYFFVVAGAHAQLHMPTSNTNIFISHMHASKCDSGFLPFESFRLK